MCIGNCSLSKLCCRLGLWKHGKVLERTPICFLNFLSDLKHKNGASTLHKTSDSTLFWRKRHLIIKKKIKLYVLTSPGEMINLLSTAENTVIRTRRKLVSWSHQSPLRLCPWKNWIAMTYWIKIFCMFDNGYEIFYFIIHYMYVHWEL